MIKEEVLLMSKEELVNKYQKQIAGKDDDRCTRCSNCSNCSDCSDCSNCSNCSYCSDCSYCFGLNNGRFHQYKILNVQFTKEEYENKIKTL